MLLAVAAVGISSACTGGGSGFATLDRDQQAEDEIPADVLQSADLDPASTRLAGEYDEFTYWLAMNEIGQICVVATGDAGWIGSGCGSGTRLRFSHGNTTVHVVPDGNDPTRDETRDWTLIGPNLAVEN